MSFATKTQTVQETELTGQETAFRGQETELAGFGQQLPYPYPSFCARCGGYVAPEGGQIQVNSNGVPELFCDLCTGACVLGATYGQKGFTPCRLALDGVIGQHAANQGPCLACESVGQHPKLGKDSVRSAGRKNAAMPNEIAIAEITEPSWSGW